MQDAESSTVITPTAGMTHTVEPAVVLARAGHITGTVTGADGGGILAVVTVYQQNEAGEWGWAGYTWSDDEGRYDLGGLLPGFYRVYFQCGGDCSEMSEWYDNKVDEAEATSVEVTLGQTRSNIDAALSPGATIGGRVTNTAGAGIPDAYITVERLVGSVWAGAGYAYSDAQGDYRIANLPAGTYRVHFDGPWWSDPPYIAEYYPNRYSAAEAESITLAQGQSRLDINAVLEQAGRIEGSVTSEGVGSNIYYYITAYRRVLVDGVETWPAQSTNWFWSANYAFNMLPPGTYRLQLTPWLYETFFPEWYDNAATPAAAKEIVLGSGETATADFVLTPASVIYAFAYTEGGAPLAGIEVRLYKQIGGVWSWVESRTTADPNQAVFRLASGGDYILGFFDPSGAFAAVFSGGSSTFDGADVIRLELGDQSSEHVSLAGGGAIEGTVRTPQGVGYAGAEVTALGADGGFLGRVVSGAGGVYRLGGLAAGNHYLYVRDLAGTYAWEYYQDQDSLASATAIAVPANGSVGGKDIVLDPPAPPLADIASTQGTVVTDPKTGEVTVSMASGNRSDVTVTRSIACASGAPTNVKLVLRGAVVVKEYAMVLSGGSWTGTIPGADVQENATVEVTWVCSGAPAGERVGKIQLYDPSGLVTDADTGRPIPGATVTLYQVPGWRAAANAVDSGDNVCQSNLSKPAGAPWSQEAPVAQGLLADPNSGLIDPAVNPQTTNAQGRYGWDVAAGCWYITVAAPGYYPVTSPVVGVPTEVTDLDIQLSGSSVTAQFSATPRTGNTPLTVQFSDASSGPVQTRLWSFGDGTTSSETNPSHTYTTPGFYTVKLSVSGPAGSDSEEKIGYVEVRDVPVAGLKASYAEPAIVGQATLLKATITAGTGVRYGWSFGDGTSGAGKEVQHTYAAPGTYNAVVTATNARGTTTATTSVQVLDAAVTAVQISKTGEPRVGKPMQFTATANGTNVRITWNFGDGSAPALGSSVSHTFAAPGSYNVVVTATNTRGSKTAATTLQVLDVAVDALTVSVTGEPVAGKALQFTATAQGTNVHYVWDFGDGSPTVPGSSVSHTFAKAGSYAVKVTASNSAGSKVATRLLVVRGPDTPQPQTFEVAGQIFRDANGNGRYDGGEGVAGVKVILRSAGMIAADGTRANLLKETVTDMQGNYRFSGIPAGSYTLEVVVPEGMAVVGDTERVIVVGAAGGTPPLSIRIITEEANDEDEYIYLPTVLK